jgi:3-oxoacyl-(acyl-carrier-protein) synthase
MAQAKVQQLTPQRSTDSPSDLSILLARLAAAEALQDAGLDSNACGLLARALLCVGSGAGSFEMLENNFRQWLDPTQNLHPLAVLRGLHNSVAADLSIRHGIRGPSRTFAMACASGAAALANAFDAIRSGRRRLAVVCAVDAPLCPSMLDGWLAMRIYASASEAAGGHDSVAFGIDRAGIVLGEAAVCVVLEDLDFARMRGAQAQLELLGVGESSDAHSLFKPGVYGQIESMQSALDDAGLPANSITYVNAHATGTRLGDQIEAQSITALFGSMGPWVSSTKGIHGHTLGAAGLMELGVIAAALRSRVLPATYGLSAMGTDCLDLRHVTEPMDWPRDAPLVAMSNSFAFGGSNVSIIAGLPA